MTHADAGVAEEIEEVAAPSGPLAGDPAMLGLPVFIAGSVALGLTEIGYTSAASVGPGASIILFSNALGLLIATIWAAALGQTAVAGIFGIFTAFWASFGFLLIGLVHNWYGISTGLPVGGQPTPNDVPHTLGMFVISWLVVVGALTLGTLRLPSAFTLLFVLVDLALALVLSNALSPSDGVRHFAGYVIFAFSAVGVYLFLGACSAATGGKPLPVGRPVLGGS